MNLLDLPIDVLTIIKQYAMPVVPFKDELLKRELKKYIWEQDIHNCKLYVKHQSKECIAQDFNMLDVPDWWECNFGYIYHGYETDDDDDDDGTQAFFFNTIIRYNLSSPWYII